MRAVSMLWGEVIGLIRPMRLIDKSLGESKRGVLEHASHIIFGHFGRLDESEAAVSLSLSLSLSFFLLLPPHSRHAFLVISKARSYREKIYAFL